MDIHLSDGSAFNIFNCLTVETPIIFITAYDEYAIQAFDANGIDYLLKSIDEEKLLRGLNKYNKVNNQEENSDYQKQLNNLLIQMEKPYKNSLLIYFQEKIIPIKTTDIDFIHSENGIVTIYMNNKQRHSTNHTLETMEIEILKHLYERGILDINGDWEKQCKMDNIAIDILYHAGVVEKNIFEFLSETKR